MTTQSNRIGLVLAASLGAMLASAPLFAAAPVPVEESRGSYGAGSSDATPSGAIDAGAMSDRPSSGGDTGRLSELFYQLQVLQQEVQELRGTVEEQRHRVDRLARDQQEQYLDLDRRMQALRGGERAPLAAGSDSNGPSAGMGAAAGAGSGAAGGSLPSSSSGSERDDYTAAFDLMKQRQFAASTEAFQRLVEDYPNGGFTPNAYYWLGELHLAQDQNEEARQAFAQVINLYPDHQKVPDALYKLGVAYHRLGDVGRAREYLNRVINDYKQTSAAGLAQSYLAEL